MTLLKRISFLVFIIFSYQQAFGVGVTQCYHCFDEECEQEVTVETCSTLGEGDYSCIFLYAPGIGDDPPVQARACINDKDTYLIRECAIVDEGEDSTCFVCQEDLCNTNKTTILETNTGVKECYSCKGSCEKMVVQKCSEEGDHVCLTSTLKYGSDLHEFRGCYLENEEIVNTCKNIDMAEDGSCNLCREDLCNK